MAFNDISTFIDKIKMLESTDAIAEELEEPAIFVHPLVLAMRELQSEGIVESYHTDSLALTEIAEDNEIDEEIAYHSSIDDITAFHPLTHFGTEKAAKDRMIYKKYKDGKIYKVDLDIKNPLTIKDFSGIHYDRYYAFELRRLNLISQEEMEAITRIEDKADLRKALLDKLKELGIDGFVYKNRYEDKGNISYVIVDPNQVKVLSVEPVTEGVTEARDILVEYSRAKTAEMVGIKLLQALANDTPQWGPPRLVQIQKTVFEEPWQRQRPEVLQSWINEVLVAIEDADPTPNKVYTPWLARMYAKGDTKLEDLNRQDVLRIYDLGKKRRMIKPEHSDINRFKTYREFETMMFDNYEFDDIENIAKKEEEKGKAKKVYEDDTVTVIVPEDTAAACRYGRGTRWCTAAVRGQNYFDQYNSQGKLYILIPKTPTHEGEKYQLHFPSGQFMDENDHEVYLPKLLGKRFPKLIPFFKQHEPKINDFLYFADVETITDIVRQIRELTLARADEMIASGENFLDDPGRPERFLRVAKSVLDQDPSTILSKYENMYDEDERRNVSVRWLPVILGSQMQKSARGSEGAGTALVWLGRWMCQLFVGKSGTRLAGVVVQRPGYELTENAIIEASPNTLEGSFTPDLVESKTWLAKMLAKGLKGKNAGTIYVLGSWYGNMGIFLQQAGVKFDKLVLIEPNEKWLMHSKELLDTLNDEGKLVLIHQKAEDAVYEKPGVVINTSCNETGPVFLTKLPDNMLCLLQARNNVDDVLISTEDLQEFDELFPLGKTYYTGERELADPETDYTRYMKIGRAGKALSETASTGQGGGSAGSSGGQMVGGPTTYEQEYDMFKRKGPRRIIAMTNESSSTRLKDLCTVKTNFPDADFWLQRNGSESTVGTPTKTFSPDNIGIKVTATNVLDPTYLYYMMMHIHNTGYWKARATGTLRLVHIKASDVANMPVGNNSVEESTDILLAGTYQQEHGRFEGKGPEHLTAMTNEALDSKPYKYDFYQIGNNYIATFVTANNIEYETIIRLLGMTNTQAALTADGEDADGEPVEVSFRIDDKNGKLKTGIENTGDARRVFATVIDIVKKYTIMHEPIEIHFFAEEPSRVKLYDAFIARLDRGLPEYELVDSWKRGATGKHYMLQLKTFKK